MNNTGPISSQNQNRLFNKIGHCLDPLLKGVRAVVNRVALGIFLELFISFSLLYLHHNLFALGFIIGFVFDEQVRYVVDKVNVVFNAKRTLVQKFRFFGVGTFFALYTMPTSLIIATLYNSSQMGAWLYQSNRKSQSLPNINLSRNTPSSPSTLSPSNIHSNQNIIDSEEKSLDEFATVLI